VWKTGQLPPRPWDGAKFDAAYAECVDSGRRPGLYAHLMRHDPAAGFYLPIEFEEVIVLDNRLRVLWGDTVGSSQTLLWECEHLLRLLEAPHSLTPNGRTLRTCIRHPHTATAPWQRHPTATRVCLILREAAVRSIDTGAAIVYT